MYVYIDESGDTGYTKKSTRYFILTAVMVDNPFVLRRIAKNVHHYNLDKKRDGILHAYKENDLIKKRLTKILKRLDIKCFIFTLDKSSVFVKDPYLYMLEKISVNYLKSNINQIILARKETRRVYNEKIIKIFDSCNLKFKLSSPALEKSLQIADFYSWVCFSYLEYKHSDYFELLKNQIYFI